MDERRVVSDRSRLWPSARRWVDLVFVALTAPFVLLLLLVAAVAIKLDSRGPVLIGHERLGRGGRKFRLLKLRTMVRDAEERKKELMHLNVLPWPDFKIPDDPRITRVGSWLRKTSLDELPQLWNLARGDLTLVGPRPCSIELDKYELWQTERLEAVPGLFGRWQAEARGNADFVQRCRMDIGQIRRRSIGSDAEMTVKTLVSVLAGRGSS